MKRVDWEPLPPLQVLASQLLRAWWSARAVVVEDETGRYYRAERPNHDGAVYVVRASDAWWMVNGTRNSRSRCLNTN